MLHTDGYISKETYKILDLCIQNRQSPTRSGYYLYDHMTQHDRTDSTLNGWDLGLVLKCLVTC